VLATRGPSSVVARDALASLCETYWAPVFEFIRHSGRNPDDARDVTQAFFARVIEKGDFSNARPELGRFRTFLLTAVRHFLANQYDHGHAAKRGGAVVHVPVNADPERESSASVDPATNETPETIYERRWALAVLDAAMARLASDSDRGGRGALFNALRPFLTGEQETSFASVADALGLAEASVRVALHRLRKQYGQCLRDTLAETVSDPADVNQEVDYLLDVLGREPSGSSLKHSAGNS
jgi:RNA polymerase sigma factor (sigma-70 family)